jgi:hypothetical protein
MCPAAAAAASMCNNNIIMGGIIYFHYTTSTHSAVFVAFSSSFLDIFILFYFFGSCYTFTFFMPLVIILVALCWRIRRRRRFFCGFLLLCVYTYVRVVTRRRHIWFNAKVDIHFSPEFPAALYSSLRVSFFYIMLYSFDITQLYEMMRARMYIQTLVCCRQ